MYNYANLIKSAFHMMYHSIKRFSDICKYKQRIQSIYISNSGRQKYKVTIQLLIDLQIGLFSTNNIKVQIYFSLAVIGTPILKALTALMLLG